MEIVIIKTPMVRLHWHMQIELEEKNMEEVFIQELNINLNEQLGSTKIC